MEHASRGRCRVAYQGATEVSELDQIVSGMVWSFQGWAEVFDLYDYPDAPVAGGAMAGALRALSDMFVRHYLGIYPTREQPNG
jgi:hypothetical protein